ncbi:MAG: DUF4126 domain-containing protein [Deltaproteobacteria bacterium]|nr:DUF4126 domain-containing protein [Deltaproteobacteria bacterium]
METIISLLIGIGLSAACGFRVFIPMLGVSVAAISGHIDLSPGFEWIGAWPVLISFAAATALEIGAYYIPWLDHVLDGLMTPAAIVAGTILTASMLGDVSPFLKWSLAIIAGGGASAIVQGGTVALRAASTGSTGGLANFFVSTGELLGSSLITVFAILLPVLCFFVVILICFLMVRKMMKSQFIKKIFQGRADKGRIKQDISLK